MVETTHVEKRKWSQKTVLILLFSADFSYTCWFLCNLLLYLPLATDIWWVSVIFNFIWPVLTDMGLIFKFLIFSPWKITFCWKNKLWDTFSRGYPVWKCELWLDLSNKTQKHNSAGCDHKFFIYQWIILLLSLSTISLWKDLFSVVSISTISVNDVKASKFQYFLFQNNWMEMLTNSHIYKMAKCYKQSIFKFISCKEKRILI